MNITTPSPMEYFPSTPLILSLSITGLLVSIMAFFPGWMSPDSFAHYGDAISGRYHDWHPILLAWEWRQLDKLYQGPALMLLQDLLLYWGSWTLLAVASRKTLGYWAFLIPLLAFWPGLLYPLGQIWKDILFASLMMFVWGALYWSTQLGQKISWTMRLILFCALVLAFGVKTNGITAIPFVTWYWIRAEGWGRGRWIRQVTYACLLVLALVGVARMIVPSKDIVKTHPFQYTQTYDLLALSVASSRPLLPDYVLKRVGNSPEKLKSLYWVGGNNLLFYNVAGNLTTVDQGDLSSLDKRWRESVLSNFPDYCRHRLANFLSLLRVGEPSTAIVAFPIIVENSFGFSFQKNSFSNWLVLTPEKFPWMYFPWIYLLGLFIGNALAWRDKAARAFCNPLTLSAVFFLLPHFFIAPSADYRYLYYSIFCSMWVLIVGVSTSIMSFLKDGRS